MASDPGCMSPSPHFCLISPSLRVITTSCHVSPDPHQQTNQICRVVSSTTLNLSDPAVMNSIRPYFHQLGSDRIDFSPW